MRMKLKYFVIISIILLSTFVLGCINKIEPSSNSKVILDQKHPSQTYIITTDDTESKGNIEVSVDDIFQTNIPIVSDNDTYSWTIYGNNLSKGDHEIKFNDGDNSYNRYITNNIDNNIANIGNNSIKINQETSIDFNTLLPGLINLSIVIFMVVVAVIVYQIIKKLKIKGPTFKDLVLTCPNCRDREIYHDIKKDELINIYKCRFCGSPRIINTKLDDIDEPEYDKMVKLSDESEI